jgi:hypothetical protein
VVSAPRSRHTPVCCTYVFRDPSPPPPPPPRMLATVAVGLQADYLEPDWQQSFWGSNYPRLQAYVRGCLGLSAPPAA